MQWAVVTGEGGMQWAVVTGEGVTYMPKQGKGDLQSAGSSRTHFLRGTSLITTSSTSPHTL